MGDITKYKKTLAVVVIVLWCFILGYVIGVISTNKPNSVNNENDKSAHELIKEGLERIGE